MGSCRVHERVDTTEVLDCCRDDCGRSGFIGEINRHRSRTTTKRGDLSFESEGGLDVLAEREHDIAATLGEHSADGRTNATATSGDQHCTLTSGEIVHWSSYDLESGAYPAPILCVGATSSKSGASS
jgi:hypothetical protein